MHRSSRASPLHGLRSWHGGSGKSSQAATLGKGSGPGYQPVGLATHLVVGLVKDGVVVIDVHDLQEDGDISRPGRGPIVGGSYSEVDPVYLLIVHCPVCNDLP